MPIISIPGITESYEAARGTGDYLGKVADAAANFACTVYKSYPNEIVPNPVATAIRGFYDSLCANRPPGLPDAPVPPFNGGQCACVNYLVTIKQTNSTGSETSTGTYTGPLGGLVRIKNQTFPDLTDVFMKDSVCSEGSPTGTNLTLVGVETNDGVFKVSIESVVRADGLPDNCGNPPPQYPNTNLPSPGDYNGTGTITYNDGNSFTVPLVYAPITPTLSLNPKFNVTVNGTLNLQFDLGGVKIDLGDDSAPPSLPPSRFTDPSDALDRIDREVRDVKDRVDDIRDILDNPPPGGKECSPPQAPPPETDPDLDKDTKSEDDPKEEAGIERLKWVKIILTKLPDKVQFGDGAPNCYFAGWMEFKSGTACYSREQINFQTSLFLAPAGADGYAYTLTNGAEGYAIVYKRKE